MTTGKKKPVLLQQEVARVAGRECTMVGGRFRIELGARQDVRWAVGRWRPGGVRMWCCWDG